ncbi:hypothetical protein PGTUg99_018950 [Puccinia graminis f. sp. tritici]|uniref:No apical meristem-associated C-terminal domain-containing protein n=1 Tax=Puccinia graminis f. sp. tritici TaxID=56615 RepID=A0A5B0S437_PUCGR|nr:hypothetical protein PGTUg99_018950 [Puccinia graminis f. sp. tritici]
MIDPALQALMPRTNKDSTEIEMLSAPQTTTRKRNMSTTDDTPSSNAPTPKNPPKKTVKPKPKKVVKNKKTETPKANATPKAVQTPNVTDTPNAAQNPNVTQTPKRLTPFPTKQAKANLALTTVIRRTKKAKKKPALPTIKNTRISSFVLRGLRQLRMEGKVPIRLARPFGERSQATIVQRSPTPSDRLEVSKINHRNPSDTTATNRISMALSLFTQLHEKPFTYMCCYNLLSTSPKWHEYNISMDKKHEVKKAPNPNPSSPLPGFLPSSTPADTTTSDASEDESTQQEPTRPIGRKKSKIAYQEEKLDVSNHEHLKKMASAHVDIVEAVKNQKDSISAQQSALERLADEAIMSKDLTGADEDVRRYYFLQRKKFLACLEKEMSESGPAAPST